MIEVGAKAVEFCLEGTGNKQYCLKDFIGSVVVLAFYPADFSPVCTNQMRAYSESIEDFRSYGAVMLGISPQSVSSHESFKERLGIEFPLLADVEKRVADSYGVLGPLGFYRRSVFVLDKEHIVRYAHVAKAGLTYRSSNELLEAIRKALATG
jgi:peroxiredoxin